jgi:hypothetical protein
MEKKNVAIQRNSREADTFEVSLFPPPANEALLRLSNARNASCDTH